LGDHHPVEIEVEVVGSDFNNILPVKRRSFKDVDFDMIGRKVAGIKLSNIEDPMHLDNQVQLWSDNFIAILDECAPIRNYPRVKQRATWVNNDTRGLMRLRTSIARKIRLGTATVDDQGTLTNLKRCIKSRIRAAIKSRGREAMAANKPKDTWKFIRQATFTHTNTAKPLLDIGDLNSYFADQVKGVAVATVVDLNTDASATPPIKFEILPMDCVDTQNLLRRIKSNTATGCDNIPAFLIKKLASFLAPNVTSIYNSSIQNSIYPSIWKKANVAAIYKNKGSKTEASNYRPISVLPVLGRTLEKAICTQLQLFCDQNNIIPNQQFGFRKNSSCEQALLAATDCWYRDLSDGKLVGALLVDLSKAFDSISHPQLLQDLEDIGCDQAAYDWFASFLTSRQQRVKSGPNYSNWVPVGKGVPQGSPLSPLLFNIVVRHLPKVADSDVFQFADDLTNSVADTNFEGLTTKLQSTYSKVKSFCEERMLKINLDKTQLIVFKPASKKFPPNFQLTLDNSSILPSPTVTLLGMTIDQHLTMGPHIDTVVKKCRGLLGVLRRAATHLPKELLYLIYISLIRSHLEFGSAIFINAAETHLRKLDVIQKVAARVITGSSSQTHSAPLLTQLGLDSLHSRRLVHINTLIDNIRNGKGHPYFKDFFNKSNLAEVTTTTKTTSAKLQGKRFRNFGTSFQIDHISRLETSSRPLDISSRGHSLSQDTSLLSTSASSTSDNTQPTQSRSSSGDDRV